MIFARSNGAWDHVAAAAAVVILLSVLWFLEGVWP